MQKSIVADQQKEKPMRPVTEFAQRRDQGRSRNVNKELRQKSETAQHPSQRGGDRNSPLIDKSAVSPDDRHNMTTHRAPKRNDLLSVPDQVQ